ncbi:MAG: hypothetical protein J6C02_03725, partial [Peptococcaceae bacterium]|nr:hypothetical protein [Peptococcaceae bacterium]
MENQFFCQVNVWIETEDGLKQWLASFEDDPAFLKRSLYINLLDSVDSVETRAAVAAFCAKYPDNASAYAMPECAYAVCYNKVRGSAKAFKYVNYTTTAALVKASDLKRMDNQISGQRNIAAWSFYPVSVQPDGSHKPYL